MADSSDHNSAKPRPRRWTPIYSLSTSQERFEYVVESRKIFPPFSTFILKFPFEKPIITFLKLFHYYNSLIYSRIRKRVYKNSRPMKIMMIFTEYGNEYTFPIQLF